MTAHEKGQAADARSAACPLCTAKFDIMLLELLRTWRELWRQLGALQQVHHAADHGTAGTVPTAAMREMSRALNKNTMSNSMCPCLAADRTRARRAFLTSPALPAMPENHEDYDCE